MIHCSAHKGRDQGRSRQFAQDAPKMSQTKSLIIKNGLTPPYASRADMMWYFHDLARGGLDADGQSVYPIARRKARVLCGSHAGCRFPRRPGFSRRRTCIDTGAQAVYPIRLREPRKFWRIWNMDFLGGAGGRDRAQNWFRDLQAGGQECAAVDFDKWFSSGTTVPMAYQSAVAWHNITVDERFPSAVAERAFADYVDRILDPSDGASTTADVQLLSFLWNVNTPQRATFKTEYHDQMVAAGETPGAPPTGISPDTDGWERLASLVKHVSPPRHLYLDPDSNPDGYLEWYLTNSYAPAVVWLTRYRDMGDCLSSQDGKECLSRVGVECNELRSGDPRAVYVIVVTSDAIWDHLRIPTVADSALYYLWGATRKPDGPTGMTRHTLLGHGHGVPELVVKTEQLVPLLDSGDVRLEARGLSCGSLHISREHAEKRWHDEIEHEI